MKTRIKVCCIRSLAEARMAIDGGADALGFVGATPPTPRTIPDSEIAAIIAAIPPPVATFLLSTGRTADEIAEQLRRTRPTAVQILSHLDPAESARLAQIEEHVRRVQVIHVEGPEALDLIPVYAPNVHAFLLDSGRPNAPMPQHGGTGRQHDWIVSAAFVAASPLPVYLAGGLSAENTSLAIRQVRPFALDLCTGARTDGHLDRDKLSAFVAAARAADEEQRAFVGQPGGDGHAD